MTLDEPRHGDARARADQLRRDRAGAARRRPGPPGLRQPLRRDRVRRPAAGALLCTRRPRSRGQTPRRGWSHVTAVEGRRAALDRVRDRAARASSAAAATPAAPGARSSRRARCRNTVGAVLDPVARACGAASRSPPGETRSGQLHDRASPSRARRRSSWPTSSATRAPSRARSSWPGPTRGSSCATSTWRPTGAPLPGAGRVAVLQRPRVARAAGRAGAQRPRASRASGPTASPATARSCWCASTTRRRPSSSQSCCWPTSTGG